MKNETDSIELRSEKVRDLIGQIPPLIIRTGISIIFFVIVLLFVCSYYFKYSYIIKSQVILKKENHKITGIVELPANEISKVNPGQEVIIDFDNVPYMTNEKLKSHIDYISKNIVITKKKAIFIVYIKIPDPLINDNGNQIIFNDLLVGNIEIITAKMSFYERIFQFKNSF